MSTKDLLHDRVWDAYYGKLGPNWMRDTRSRIHWICERVTGDTVLDVGCSSGVVPILLGREGRTVTGIDNDSLSISEALEHLTDEAQTVQDRVSFIEDDFLGCDRLAGRQFASIVMSELLEHLLQPEVFVSKAREHLKESGQLIVTVPFGINDFIDHKKTYYLSNIHALVSREFEVVSHEIIGKWIGLVCVLRDAGSETTVRRRWTSSEVEDLEQGFYKLERNLTDQLSGLQAKLSGQTKSEQLSKKELAESTNKLAALNQDKSKLQDELNSRESELASLRNELTKIHDESRETKQELQTQIVRRKESEAKLGELLQDKAAAERQLQTTDDQLTSLQHATRKQVEDLSRQIETLKENLNRLEAERTRAIADSDAVRASISFQLGRAIQAATSSWRGLFSLPATVVRLRREHRFRSPGADQPAPSPTPVKNAPILPPPCDKETLARKFRRHSAANESRLRVAAVMDEFTQHSFAPDCELLQLDAADYKQQLTDFEPDFVFLESAWRGKDDGWLRKVSNASRELIDVIAWARESGIPTIFWNKEDPIHFGTFLPVAELVDVVFTTDIDCISKYKKHVGHDDVYLLPFAAQPVFSNPFGAATRQDKFFFAGSYYLKYPERQKDFARLLDAVAEYRQVDIYDRNFNKPHPHYQFPERYAPLIRGCVAFADIDKVYKGYKYGINVNTIKQSQTMFARRVFELLASNTAVVSNYSRAMRILFGDLVISSDHSEEVRLNLDRLCGDETHFRKQRLLGLRRVMEEHTYARRLEYIAAKLGRQEFEPSMPAVAVIGIAKNQDEVDSLLASFRRQSYSRKQLFLLNLSPTSSGAPASHEGSIHESFEPASFADHLSQQLHDIPLTALFSPNDYYGTQYLKDLCLASTYSAADAFGKRAHYSASESGTQLLNDGEQYMPADELQARSAVVRTATMPSDWVGELLDKPESAIVRQASMLATDEFHYCRDLGTHTGDDIRSLLEDPAHLQAGIDLSDRLLPVAESISPENGERRSQTTVPEISGADIFDFLTKPGSGQISLSQDEKSLTIESRLHPEKHAYIRSGKRFDRKELNFESNSTFRLECESTLELSTVFEFLDENGEKISHAIQKAGEKNALAIPEECRSVQFSLRIKGSGTAVVHRLCLGDDGELPSLVVGSSKYLVVSKQYPAYDDLYRYGFLHSRVRAYRKAGVHVDVFRITPDTKQRYREFEGVDVASGDAELLSETLKSGQYTHVLVHILDERIWRVVQEHLDRLKVIVWAHGSEIQVWQQRQFEFARLPASEISRQKLLSDKRVELWQSVISPTHRNLAIVFVSDWLRSSSLKDMKVESPLENSRVIHNYIDSDRFPYRKKVESDRLRILSIRPFTSLAYGNDLTVQAIVELSHRDFFDELSFSVFGNGDLFDETVEPLSAFDNVTVEKKFLRQSEIAEQHRLHGVFLVPSRMDTQGVSRDEAMSSGLVPVTCSVAGVPEFVDKSCAMLVQPEDPIALADAIEFLYRNSSTYLQLSADAGERVRSQSRFDQTIRREMDLFTKPPVTNEKVR